MVTDYGMSEKLGLRTFGQEYRPAYLGFGPPTEKDYSERTAQKIDEEIHDILENAYSTADKIREDHRPRLVHIAKRLMEKETLEGSELEAAFDEPLSDLDTTERLEDERSAPQKAVVKADTNSADKRYS